MSQIFISYSRTDYDKKEAFVQQLKRSLPHIAIWSESYFASQGTEQWWSIVLEALQSSEVFIYLLTNDSLNSKYSQAEFDTAKHLERPCIAVILQARLQIPDSMAFSEIVDLSNSKGEEFRFAALVVSILAAIPKGERAKLKEFTYENPKAKPRASKAKPNRIPRYLAALLALMIAGFAIMMGMVYSGAFAKGSSDEPASQGAEDLLISDEQNSEETGLEAELFSNAEWQTLYPNGFQAEINSVPMLLVPKGCFEMGNNPDAWFVADDGSLLQGLVSNAVQCFDEPFWIDQTEVTQAQFRAFGGSAANPSFFSGDSRPVEQISWQEARDFCEKRGARLPSEAEWEYAARGIDGLVYPWGNEFFEANAVLGGSDGTALVGSIPAGASWVGALDMAGNVWEWTGSVYRSYPYSMDDESLSGSESPDFYSLRGGSWNTDSQYINMITRNRAPVHGSANDIGFRCAMDYRVAEPE